MTHQPQKIKHDSTTCSRWIAVCVDMLDHPIVGMNVPPPKPADAARHAIAPMIAWQDIIASAAYAAKTVNHKGAEIVLDRGQFLAGRAYWAKRWNWGEQSVRSFFSKLCSSKMVAICNQSNGHLANIASICNYDAYQSRKTARKPVEKPEENQSPTSGQPVPNQTLTRDTKDTKVSTPGVCASAHENSESENDRLHREAMERGEALKRGTVAKSARAEHRTKGQLDGSHGVRLENGKLQVLNGSASELAQEFPGVDLSAVCNRAAPELSRMSWPTRDDAMAVIRKWAQIASDDAKRRPASSRPAASAKPTIAQVLAKRAEAGVSA